jgi:hypothetical protein
MRQVKEVGVSKQLFLILCYGLISAIERIGRCISIVLRLYFLFYMYFYFFKINLKHSLIPRIPKPCKYHAGTVYETEYGKVSTATGPGV